MTKDKFDPVDISPGPQSEYPKRLAHIATLKPGRWHQVREFESVDGAKAQLFRIRRDPSVVPNGVWEFATQRMDGGSRLMAKYQGPAKKPDISWWRNGELVTEVPEDEAKAKSAGAKKRWTGANKGKGRMTKDQKKAALKRGRG
jgi:hypothetical protein